jgi:hypothetical protein
MQAREQPVFLELMLLPLVISGSELVLLVWPKVSQSVSQSVILLISDLDYNVKEMTKGHVSFIQELIQLLRQCLIHYRCHIFWYTTLTSKCKNMLSILKYIPQFLFSHDSKSNFVMEHL